ncbi:MAG: carboxypeptidase-like regulatory domain-containing protein [Fimbriiglobus sp.]
MHRLLAILVFAASASITAGCGGDDVGGRTYKIDPAEQSTISGTVKFGKQNVPHKSRVSFSNPDLAITAVGSVDENGNFTLKPAENNTGLPAGKYKVTITPPPPPPPTEEELRKMDGNAMTRRAIVSPNLPEKFYNVMTSGLAVAIAPGPNTFEIDLATSRITTGNATPNAPNVNIGTEPPMKPAKPLQKKGG